MREPLVPGYSQAVNDNSRRKKVLPTTSNRAGSMDVKDASLEPAMKVKPACDFYLDADNTPGERQD